jgi:hypothetical protein
MKFSEGHSETKFCLFQMVLFLHGPELFSPGRNAETVMWMMTKEERDVSTTQNESIGQVRLCFVCESYMLISFGIHHCQTAMQFTNCKGALCPSHRAQAVSRRLLTPEVASVNFFRADYS